MGKFFKQTTLQDIRLHVQLNHNSISCRNPIPCHQEFVVLHSNGIHKVTIVYCSCEHQITFHWQLLCCGWYLGSQLFPKTCATFHLLERFHLLLLCSKLLVYNFYRTLEKLNSNIGILVPKSRIKVFVSEVTEKGRLGACHWWCCGNEVWGVSCTLSLISKTRYQHSWRIGGCSTCIQVSGMYLDCIVLTENIRFLYAVLLCINVNFCLKNQLVSLFSQDSGLGIGWAYFVAHTSYEQYVMNNTSDVDVSAL